MIGGREERILNLVRAAISERGRLPFVAKFVDIQHKAMGGAWIGDLFAANVVQGPLIAQIKGFAGMSEEHGVAVWSGRLDAGNVIVPFCDAIGESLCLCSVERINFLMKHCAFE